MAKYLTDRLNAVFIETALTRWVALNAAEKAGLSRSDALAGACDAAQDALRQREEQERAGFSPDRAFVEGTPEYAERMAQRNRQVAAMKGRA